MNLLALDTSSVACTVALKIGAKVTALHEEKPREHTRLLLPMIRDALQDAGAVLSDLDAIVLGNGPGSFIGMRIAASVAQGLAHGARLNIIPVSSLAAVAAQVFAECDAREVAVAQDAHMNEVYFGHFERAENHLPVPLTDERLQGQGLIGGLGVEGCECRIAAGCGWQRYPQLIAENNLFFREQSNILYPHAQFLLPLASLSEAIAPQHVDPAYLRRSVAKKPLPPKS